MKDPKTYKVTAKISIGGGYKPLFKRGICVAQNEAKAKEYVKKEIENAVRVEPPAVVVITKIERIPTQFVFNSTI